MLNKLHVKLKGFGYDIVWFDRIQDIIPALENYLSVYKSFVITNDALAKAYKHEIKKLFGNSDVIKIKDGETQKNLNTIKNLSMELIKRGAGRKSLLIAFGGGVIGDITGFLASIYMRGIDFIQIPTTLLAMVDSSVGGKTGVNIAYGKNMIGTFYQPRSVLISTEFLRSLPIKEIRCGLAEMVKSALIKSHKLYKLLHEKAFSIYNMDPILMDKLSYESIKIKKWFVEKDEKEKELRAILNFGHTLAHSLESWFEYKYINHGEAVSIGLNFASYYSFRKGFLSENTWLGIRELLNRMNLPQDFSYIQDQRHPKAKDIVELMRHDKKNKNGDIYFVTLEEIGKYRLPEKIDPIEFTKILEDYIALC